MSDQPTDKTGRTLDKAASIVDPPKAGESMERFQSEDSAPFYEPQDEYDDFDDFAPVGKPSGTGGGAKGLSQKMTKRDDQKGGGQGGVYSAKHIRQKEALHASKKSGAQKR
jgi:hypothetical protein